MLRQNLLEAQVSREPCGVKDGIYIGYMFTIFLFLSIIEVIASVNSQTLFHE